MDQPQPPVNLQQYVREFIESTRPYVFIRPADGLLILRPSRTYYLNKMGLRMLDALYSAPEGPDAEAVVSTVASEYHVDPERVRADLRALLASLQDLLAGRYNGADNIKEMRFRSHPRTLPVLSEIAITYRCQNRCTFCYADAPARGRQGPEMTTAEVKRIIDRIFDEAHCPTVSFTGGEPTLRDDLPELIAYAHSKFERGEPMRVNLITNGLRCADREYVHTLAQAGLDSAQLSLEGPTAEVHDAITQHPGAWERAVQGVHNLRAEGIHTHTNTTICGGNRA
ncbi:MAG: radical SAM protein, partial [Chloroflexi bacterium]|nr:radical SAM protein [Chloroflexota bacterium]